VANEEEDFDYRAAYHDLALVLGGLVNRLGPQFISNEDMRTADGFLHMSVFNDHVLLELREESSES